MSSAAKASRSAAMASGPSASATAKEIAHSLEPRVIRITEMPAAAIVWNTRAATPGTPAMPEPVTSTSETPGRKVRPRAPLAAGAAAFVHQAARVVGREAVAHPHRDPLLARRLDGLRMQHLGAEEGELHGLLVAHLGEHGGAGDQPGIGAVDAVDVGPDLQQLGVEGPGGDGGGVVRAAAPEEVDAAVGVAAEEAGEDGDRRGLLAQGGEGLAGGRPVGRGGQRRTAGADQRLGIEQPGVEAARREQAGDQGAGGALAEGGEEGEGGGRALAEEAEAAQQVLQLRSRTPSSVSASAARAAASSGRSGVEDLAMDRVEAGEGRHHRTARRGLLGAAQQRVGDAADRRDHHQEGAFGSLAGRRCPPRRASAPRYLGKCHRTLELASTILRGELPLQGTRCRVYPQRGRRCLDRVDALQYASASRRPVSVQGIRPSRRSSGVEQLIRNQQVVGSNPTVGSIRSPLVLISYSY